jgi:hypothetical protein
LLIIIVVIIVVMVVFIITVIIIIIIIIIVIIIIIIIIFVFIFTFSVLIIVIFICVHVHVAKVKPGRRIIDRAYMGFGDCLRTALCEMTCVVAFILYESLCAIADHHCPGCGVLGWKKSQRRGSRFDPWGLDLG